MKKNITWANAVTGSRLVFFVWFIWAAHTQRVRLALVMFLAAWGLDVVDGWVARRMKQTTRFGYVFDKAVDRVIIFVGLLVLLMNKLVPDYVFWVLMKDVAALPATGEQLKRSKAMLDMGKLGKVTAIMQGAAIVWVLLGWVGGRWVVGVVAGWGAIVGAWYVYRVYYGGK